MSIGRRELFWKGNSLFVYGFKKAQANIVPDPTYPNMWRVEVEGNLTDMVNRTRAKDAAASIVLNKLNKQESTDAR